MTKSTLSPFVVSNAKEVELTGKDGVKKTYWKKEILPSGTRKYKDETLDFSKINPSCIKAFESGAVGDVPFVFALADNSHPKPGSEEIENLAGDLHKLELSDSGSLVGYFDLSGSDKALAAIKATQGKFGVSGRIEPDYVRSDTAETFEYALTHVCGTTRPHVKGLGAWEAVELSDVDLKDTETVDLSTEVDTLEVPKTVEEGKVNVEIDKAQLDVLLAMANDYKATQDALAAMDKSKDDEGVVKLSETDQKRLEAYELSSKTAIELAEKAHIELAETRWEKKRGELARAGVPPVLLTAAEPAMKMHKRPTIELSDGTKLDPFQIIEDLLDACKGVVNLSEEGGHGFHGDTSTDAAFNEFYKSISPEILGYAPAVDNK